VRSVRGRAVTRHDLYAQIKACPGCGQIDDVDQTSTTPRAATWKCTRCGQVHPGWCSPEHCYRTDSGIRVHQQAPTCWEDPDPAEGVRFESRLIDAGDDEQVYLDMHIQCLMLRGNSFSWVVPLDTARALRDQLTTHLDSAAVAAGDTR
jgi:hypothetical protein